MTLHELMAFIAGTIWAMLWWPVGREFGRWPGAGASAAGGIVGLALGFFLVEWINRLRPHRRWARTAAVFAALTGGFVAFVAIPLWALAAVRAR